jgi:2-polyprenyl-3-methyl-5-hydroxy-6-metoxy-1,4-benzoquinol methylase
LDTAQVTDSFPATHVTSNSAAGGPFCRFCEAPLQHTFADLWMSPLSNAYVTREQLNSSETFYPLHVYVCASCFLVQVEVFESPDRIFHDYAYFSSYSDTWLAHARGFVDMAVGRFGLTSKSFVVEVASNDGYLLQYMVAKDIPVLGIEPAASVATAATAKSIPTLVKFFGRETARAVAAQGTQADLIVANNVAAHVPDINDFIAGFKILLKPTGVATFEFHHVLQLIEQNQFDTIYHEHFYYHSFTTFCRILDRHGLMAFDVDELPTHGGSLRVYVQHAEHAHHPVAAHVEDLLAKEAAAGLTRLEAYLAFGDKVNRTKDKLLSFLLQAKADGKVVVGYGAPAKGNTLLNYAGVRSDLVNYTVDRNPHKQGLYLPGSHIPILAPDAIRETKPDYVLILPWNLKHEIMEQMAYIREWGGRFLVFIPDVEVC